MNGVVLNCIGMYTMLLVLLLIIHHPVMVRQVSWNNFFTKRMFFHPTTIPSLIASPLWRIIGKIAIFKSFFIAVVALCNTLYQIGCTVMCEKRSDCLRVKSMRFLEKRKLSRKWRNLKIQCFLSTFLLIMK